MTAGLAAVVYVNGPEELPLRTEKKRETPKSFPQERHGLELNQRMTVLQTVPLPFGYHAESGLIIADKNIFVYSKSAVCP